MKNEENSFICEPIHETLIDYAPVLYQKGLQWKGS